MVCLKEDGRKGNSGRAKLPDHLVSADALRMRRSRARRATGIHGRDPVTEEQRLARREAQKRMRERVRAADAPFKLHTVENRKCGVEERHERDLSRLRVEVSVACERFWKKRGLEEPKESWITNDFVFGRGPASQQDGGAKARRELRKQARIDDAAREIEEAA